MSVTICLDTNVLISYLLGMSSQSPPARVVRMALDQQVSLVIAERTLFELRDKAVAKRYLVQRLKSDDVSRFERSIRRIATVIDARADMSRPGTRDPKDDYLLAPEIVSLVDHIVTGGRDLLEYTGVEPGFIMSAAEFLGRYAATSGDLSTK